MLLLPMLWTKLNFPSDVPFMRFPSNDNKWNFVFSLFLLFVFFCSFVCLCVTNSFKATTSLQIKEKKKEKKTHAIRIWKSLMSNQMMRDT